MSENYEFGGGEGTRELARRLRSLARFNQSLTSGNIDADSPVLQEELALWPTAFEQPFGDKTYKPQGVLVYTPAVIGDIPPESASARVVRKPDQFGSVLRLLGELSFDSVALIDLEGESTSVESKSLKAMEERSMMDVNYTGPMIALRVKIQNEDTTCIVPVSTPTAHYVVTQVSTVFKSIATGSLQ